MSKELSNNVLTIDSREVAEMLGKSHSALMKDINGSKDGKTVGIIPVLLKSNFDLSGYFIESSYKDGSGKENKCYLVTKMGCELLGNKQQGAKGILFTAKYVERFNEMEQQLQQPKLPKTYKEALQELLLQVEENERLEEENKLLKPKAEFYDDVAGSKDAIEIAAVAKVLGIKGLGRNNLFKFLRDKKILQRNNIPYQEYVDRKYFRVVEQKYNKPDGSVSINIKTLVYQSGVDYIRKLIKGE